MSNLLPIAGLLAAIALALWLRAQITSTTIFEFERGIRFTKGRFRGVLTPGYYRHLRSYTTIHKIGMRPVQLAVNSQEVLSSDGVAIKASLSATYQVTDPETAYLGSENYVAAVYTELQQALRIAVSSAEIDALLANRSSLGPQIMQHCAPVLGKLGLDLQQVAIRDLTLPGDLKKVFAQVIKARQEGVAALERARGETAALRNLANAAQMINRNPHLFQLRLLQVLGQQGGNTIVVGMPQGTTPLPIRGEGVAESLGELPPAEPEPNP